MSLVITDNGEFSKGVKFEARGSGHGLSHGPVYGSAGYLALRLDRNNTDQTVYIHKSTDGTTWTEASTGITMPFSAVKKLTYINGRYFVIGGDDQINGYAYFAYSTDGTTWTNSSTNTLGSTVYDITYSNSVYILTGAASANGTPTIKTSTNLTSWTTRFTGTVPFVDIATTGTSTVALNASTLRYSSNSTAWSAPTFTPITNGAIVNGRTFNAVATDGTNWVAVGTGGLIFSSSNLTAWALQTSGTTVDLRSISYANGTWVAYANDGTTTTILTSSNRTTWTVRSTPLLEQDNVLYRANGVWDSDNTKAVYANSVWHVGNYTSTDAATWTIFDYQVPNQQPFLRYEHKAGWNTWQTMDFWFYVDGEPSNFTIYGLVSIAPAAGQSVANTFTAALRSDSTFYPKSQWNHYRIVDDGAYSAAYLNGTRLSRAASTSNTTWRTNNGPLIIGNSSSLAESQYARPNAYYVDEFMLTNDLLNATTDTTIPVPTAPWINTDETVILLHFNENFDDDTSTPIRVGHAALVAQFTQSTAPIKQSVAASAQSASASLSATALITKNAQVSLSSSFILSTSALDLDIAQVALTSTSTLTASISVIKLASASVQSAASLSSSANRTRNANAALVVEAFELVSTIKTLPAGAYLEATSTLACTAIKTARAVTNASAQSVLTGQAKKYVGNQAVLTSAFTLAAVTDRVITFTSTEPTTSTLLASAQAIVRVVSNMQATTSLSVDTLNNIRTGGNLFNECSVACTARVTRTLSANPTSITTFLCITNNVVRAEANLQVQAFELVIGRAVNLEFSDTWIISAETTTYTIQRDQNNWSVPFEDRTYKIKG